MAHPPSSSPIPPTGRLPKKRIILESSSFTNFTPSQSTATGFKPEGLAGGSSEDWAKILDAGMKFEKSNGGGGGAGVKPKRRPPLELSPSPEPQPGPSKPKAKPRNLTSKPKARKSTKPSEEEDDWQAELRDLEKVAKRVLAPRKRIEVDSETEEDGMGLNKEGTEVDDIESDDEEEEGAGYVVAGGTGRSAQRAKKAKLVALERLRLKRSTKASSVTPNHPQPRASTSKLDPSTLPRIPVRQNLLLRPSPSPSPTQNTKITQNTTRGGYSANSANSKGKEHSAPMGRAWALPGSGRDEDLSRMFDDDLRNGGHEEEDIEDDGFADEDLIAAAAMAEAAASQSQGTSSSKPAGNALNAAPNRFNQLPVAKAPAASRHAGMPEAWRNMDKILQQPAMQQMEEEDGPEVPEDLVMQEEEEEYYQEIMATQVVRGGEGDEDYLMDDDDDDLDATGIVGALPYPPLPNPVLGAKLQSKMAATLERTKSLEQTPPPTQKSDGTLDWSPSPAEARQQRYPVERPDKGKGRAMEQDGSAEPLGEVMRKRKRNDAMLKEVVEEDEEEGDTSDEDVPLSRLVKGKGKERMVKIEPNDSDDEDSGDEEEGFDAFGDDVVDLTLDDDDDDPIEPRNAPIELDRFDEAPLNEAYDQEDGYGDGGYDDYFMSFGASQSAPTPSGPIKPQQYYSTSTSAQVHVPIDADMINPLQSLQLLDPRMKDFFYNHFRRTTASTKTREEVAEESRAKMAEAKQQQGRKAYGKARGRGGGKFRGRGGRGYRGRR